MLLRQLVFWHLKKDLTIGIWDMDLPDVYKRQIDTYVLDCDTTRILQTYSLRFLRRFIQEQIPEFEGNWKVILQADGYYFSTRYPGDGAFIVGKEDVEECWEAVEETREAVRKYLEIRK